jgi:alkylhydroperoxidase family enzyme
MATQRIKLIEPPYNEDVQNDFNVIMPKGVPPLNIFRTVANNPRVLHRMIIGGLLDKGSISIQDRELVILRSCAKCKSEYEWGVHVVAFSEKAKIKPEQVRDTVNIKVNNDLWTDKQLLLFNLVDQLNDTNTISEELWEKLCENYQDDQLIELIMLTGLYHAVSFMVNGLKIENEVFAPTFK